MTTRLAASRMSSVFGLKARPQSAKVRPFEVAAVVPADLLDEHRLLRLVAVLDRVSTAGSKPTSRAVAISAFTSLGKQEPP